MVILLLVCSLFVSSATYADNVLKEKVGEMVIVGFRGYECPETLAKQLEAGLVGGVVLYDFDRITLEWVRNISSYNQVKTLCQDLHNRSKHRLWIGIDQEGGIVNRLKPDYGFPLTLSQQELGESNDLMATRKQSQMTSKLLNELGININYAPVVDLNINPSSPCVGFRKRSFSDQPLIVCAHAQEVIAGHHENGIKCVLKHFPGHGSAAENTHDGFVDVTNTWSETELEPFCRLIAAGNVDIIMTSHVYNANLDARYPASLSKSTITGILRDHLGFDGVIISDDLQMGAIAKFFTLEQTVKQSIDAGVDILMFANEMEYDPLIAEKVVDIIVHLVETGQIPMERIEQSLARIHRLKQ